MDIQEATIWDGMHITYMWVSMMKQTGVSPDHLNEEGFFCDLLLAIKNPSCPVFVAKEEGMPVGFIMGNISYEDHLNYLSGTCLNLFVKKSHRGSGMAPNLISAIHKYFKDSGAVMEDFVTRYDEGLIKVWERKGYKPYQVVFRKEV